MQRNRFYNGIVSEIKLLILSNLVNFFSKMVYSLRASNFPCEKFIEIVILWVYYAIPFGLPCFVTFRHHFSPF